MDETKSGWDLVILDDAGGAEEAAFSVGDLRFSVRLATGADSRHRVTFYGMGQGRASMNITSSDLLGLSRLANAAAAMLQRTEETREAA